MSVAANTYLALYFHFELIKDYPLIIIATFALGAFMAMLTLCAALNITQRLFPQLPKWFLFLLTLIGLCALTVFLTASLFTLEYRSFYAQWHSPVLSKTWFFEQFFTALGAFYQFAVLGLRLYLPLTPFIVFLATIILTRRAS